MIERVLTDNYCFFTENVLMPKLIPEGPNIPNDLINQLNDDKVVFFCGAGISIPNPSNLPSFLDLLKEVYKKTDASPDLAEKREFGLKVEDSSLNIEEIFRKINEHSINIDRVFGLLEREKRLGQITTKNQTKLRNIIVDILSVSPQKGHLKLHQALMKLSTTSTGKQRLVTTNFDDRFAKAGWPEDKIDNAPKLPIPNYGWSSLVHLHGRIPRNEDKSDLILTSSDFGRAYLSEGWAAQFVIRLFQEFTVVFIGYSLNDPMIRYLTDTIMAERQQRKENFNKSYIFVPYGNKKEESKEVLKELWHSNGIEMILYNKKCEHRILCKTLENLADFKLNSVEKKKKFFLMKCLKILYWETII